MKLTYFDIRGLGEYARLLLEDQGVSYEDERINFQQWEALKPKTPFGQLPTFQDGDFYFAQTGSILRYLARKVGNGLYGKDNKEATWIDSIYDLVVDLRRPYSEVIYQNWTEDAKKKLTSEKLPESLALVEKNLKSKHDGKAFFNGETICFADYAMFEVLDAFHTLSPSILEKFPLTKAYYERVAARPNLKKYLASDKRKSAKINGNGNQ